MESNEQNLTPSERRKQTRWSVYNFLRATATLSNCPTGLLADISNEGAQVILPSHCENLLVVNQKINIHVKTSLENCNFHLNAQVKSITATEDNNLRIGVLFTDLENNFNAKQAVNTICEYSHRLLAFKPSGTQ